MQVISKREETPEDLVARFEEYHKDITDIRSEIAKAVVGQERVVTDFMIALVANGHVLIEGVPGLAKTLLIRTLSQVMGCKFSRVQFTPDLLPSDILGITTYEKERGFYVLKGPIFANFVLADEINRAPPKVQSALLEVMQEKQVTIGREGFEVEPPFFVLATQNPLENLGTYPLPEAQMDRFLFKIFIDYPSLEEERLILTQNITSRKFESIDVKPITGRDKILKMQDDVKSVYCDDKIETYIVRLIDATRNPDRYGIKLGKYLEFGASPRGSIGIYIAAKADAMLSGKTYVTPQNVKNVAPNVLRHRIAINYEGQAEDVTSDMVIKEVLDTVPVHS
ncbi:MAG: AAA family ATPase [Candidatus Woesearchaeota archaeon]